eukprot:Sspe_Gene.31610::Locus_15577_Transcript_1_1_Confidence_1.000_Length_2384::g.31610::m.31610
MATPSGKYEKAMEMFCSRLLRRAYRPGRRPQQCPPDVYKCEEEFLEMVKKADESQPVDKAEWQQQCTEFSDKWEHVCHWVHPSRLGDFLQEDLGLKFVGEAPPHTKTVEKTRVKSNIKARKFHCDACDLTCNSYTQYLIHAEGSRHQENLLLQGRSEKENLAQAEQPHAYYKKVSSDSEDTPASPVHIGKAPEQRSKKRSSPKAVGHMMLMASLLTLGMPGMNMAPQSTGGWDFPARNNHCFENEGWEECSRFGFHPAHFASSDATSEDPSVYHDDEEEEKERQRRSHTRHDVYSIPTFLLDETPGNRAYDPPYTPPAVHDARISMTVRTPTTTPSTPPSTCADTFYTNPSIKSTDDLSEVLVWADDTPTTSPRSTVSDHSGFSLSSPPEVDEQKQRIVHYLAEHLVKGDSATLSSSLSHTANTDPHNAASALVQACSLAPEATRHAAEAAAKVGGVAFTAELTEELAVAIEQGPKAVHTTENMARDHYDWAEDLKEKEMLRFSALLGLGRLPGCVRCGDCGPPCTSYSHIPRVADGDHAA